MFKALGYLVSRGWPAFLLLWAGVLAAAFWAAPPWEDVVLDREFAFLPATSPSQRGQEAYLEDFPEQFRPSNLVLVVERPHRKLLPEDLEFVDRELRPALERIQKEEGGPARLDAATAENVQARGDEEKRPIIAAIHTFKEPGAGAFLISDDGKATLVIVELTSELLERRNWSTLAKVDRLLDRLQREGKVPDGLQVSETGSAAVGRDITTRQAASARSTEVMTISVVIALLLLIYRVPLLALIPLVTVFVALQLGLKLLAILADHGIVTLFQGVQIFITVVLYGTGVDYCLFLIARYREELHKEARPRDALAETLARTGPALAASSATVTLGIGMMIFARFGEFHYAGEAIASTLVLGLIAVLTFAPALLRMGGRWLFWPNVPRHGAGAVHTTGWRSLPSRLWHKLADALQRRPGTILLVCVALMLPFAATAVANANNLEFDLLKRLPDDAVSQAGTEALRRHFPEGLAGPIIVLIRDKNIDFRSDRGMDLIATLTDRIKRRRLELGLSDLRSVSRPLGVTQRAQEMLDDMAIEQYQHTEKTPRRLYMEAQDFFVSRTHGTQIQLVLRDNPLSRSTLDNLARIKEAVGAELPQELKRSDVEFLGLTASIYDLRVVTDADQWRIQSLVLICVLLVLILLLRRPIVCLYLIASVVLCYLTALGATFAFFWALNPNGFSGLDWKVPIFLFTILVAIGEDYNIFLMTRIHEEQEKHGPVKGIAEGVIKTGGIITSCGIIMAGTFSSLLPGSLVDLKQLGFALVSGVLLDTFLIRPVLVPAFLVLLDGGRFSFLRTLVGLAPKKSRTPAQEHSFAGQLPS